MDIFNTDFSGKAAAPEKRGPTDADLAKVVKLAQEQLRLAHEIVAAEKRVDELRKQYQFIRMKLLPKEMSEVGLSSFGLEGQGPVQRERVIIGTLKKENRNKFYQWALNNGHEDLVKRSISLMFGREDSLSAGPILDKVRELLRESGKDNRVEVEDLLSIHHQTLRGWVREQFEAGAEFPPELEVNIFEQAVIQGEPKIKKAKGDEE